MESDPQVAAAEAIVPRGSLYDVVLEKYFADHGSGQRDFLMRVMVSGSKGELALLPVMEELSSRACDEVRKSDQLYKDQQEGVAGNAALMIDYGTTFIMLLEGMESNVYSFLRALADVKDVVDNVFVLFVDDDIITPAVQGWVCIDKIPPIALDTDVHLGNENEIAEAVLRDLRELTAFARLTGEQGEAKRHLFADNARINHPHIFPNIAVLQSYARSNLFLTLTEFNEHFCDYPSFTRDVEINHPADDPLKF